MAIAAGVNSPIVNAAQAKETAMIADLLMGTDELGVKYSRYKASDVRNAGSGGWSQKRGQPLEDDELKHSSSSSFYLDHLGTAGWRMDFTQRVVWYNLTHE